MRKFGVGCGGSSGEFFQHEHPGGLFGHHCRFAVALPPKNQPKQVRRAVRCLLSRPKARPKTGIIPLIPRQVFEQQVSPYCKSFLVASEAKVVADLLAPFCDGHATQKARAKARANPKNSDEKRMTRPGGRPGGSGCGTGWMRRPCRTQELSLVRLPARLTLVCARETRLQNAQSILSNCSCARGR